MQYVFAHALAVISDLSQCMKNKKDAPPAGRRLNTTRSAGKDADGEVDTDIHALTFIM